MSDDNADDNKPKKPKRLKVHTHHLDGKADKDFDTIKEARVTAAEDHALLSMRLKDLSEELMAATWDGKHRNKNLASMHSEGSTHDLASAGGMLAGIGIMFASAGTGAAVGLAAGLLGGKAQAKDFGVRRDLRRDYKGKAESEFLINLDNGSILHIPVTHDNTQALAAALEKARETVNPIDHAKRTPEEIMATVKTTIVDYMKAHSDPAPTIEAVPTKISQAVDVQDHGGAPAGRKPKSGKVKTL